MMKKKLPDYFPPGVSSEAEAKWTLCGFIAAALVSTVFLLRYIGQMNELTADLKMGRNVYMPPFADILGGSLYGFLILAVCMIPLGIYHYGVHHMGSKSVYLMRRLPDRGEYHRRCLAFPVAAFIAALACAFILLLIYYLIYMTFTPDAYIAEGQWQMIWR